MNVIKNKNGFTIVELLTSFALTSVVVVFLFNIVFLLKDAYVERKRTGTTTLDLYLFSNNMNKDFYVDGIMRISKSPASQCPTGAHCYDFLLNGMTAPTKRLIINIDGRSVSYSRVGSAETYIYNLDSTETFGTITICKRVYGVYVEGNKDASTGIYGEKDKDNNIGYEMNSFLYINIPINSTVENIDHSIKLLYPFNAHTVEGWSLLPDCP